MYVVGVYIYSLFVVRVGCMCKISQRFFNTIYELCTTVTLETVAPIGTARSIKHEELLKMVKTFSWIQICSSEVLHVSQRTRVSPFQSLLILPIVVLNAIAASKWPSSSSETHFWVRAVPHTSHRRFYSCELRGRMRNAMYHGSILTLYTRSIVFHVFNRLHRCCGVSSLDAMEKKSAKNMYRGTNGRGDRSRSKSRGRCWVALWMRVIQCKWLSGILFITSHHLSRRAFSLLCVFSPPAVWCGCYSSSPPQQDREVVIRRESRPQLVHVYTQLVGDE